MVPIVLNKGFWRGSYPSEVLLDAGVSIKVSVKCINTKPSTFSPFLMP